MRGFVNKTQDVLKNIYFYLFFKLDLSLSFTLAPFEKFTIGYWGHLGPV